jgi:hypothetical protein
LGFALEGGKAHLLDWNKLFSPLFSLQARVVRGGSAGGMIDG